MHIPVPTSLNYAPCNANWQVCGPIAGYRATSTLLLLCIRITQPVRRPHQRSKTAHPAPHLLPTPIFRNKGLRSGNFFSTTKPHRAPESPRTHFPLVCTTVRFRNLQSRHTRIRVLFCLPVTSRQDLGRLTPINRRSAHASTSSPSQSREPRKVPAHPIVHGVSSALAAVRYFRGVRSAKRSWTPNPQHFTARTNSLARTNKAARISGARECHGSIAVRSPTLLRIRMQKHFRMQALVLLNCLCEFPVNKPKSGALWFPLQRDKPRSQVRGYSGAVYAKKHTLFNTKLPTLFSTFLTHCATLIETYRSVGHT